MISDLCIYNICVNIYKNSRNFFFIRNYKSLSDRWVHNTITFLSGKVSLLRFTTLQFWKICNVKLSTGNKTKLYSPLYEPLWSHKAGIRKENVLWPFVEGNMSEVIDKTLHTYNLYCVTLLICSNRNYLKCRKCRFKKTDETIFYLVLSREVATQ